MMKQYLLLSTALLIHLHFLSQDTKPFSCASKFKNAQAKSNSLTMSQIAETEKYNVHFYALDLNMTNLNTSISGNVSIHASTNQVLDSALFELFSSFTINTILVNGNPVNYSRINSAIKVPVNALANENFIIKVDYTGTPPTAATNPLGGSGMTNASSPSWGNQVTWSLSEPFAAYEWFPCKQSLKDKIDSVSVKITVPSACKAGSNGVLEQVVDLGNGFTRYEWFHRHPIAYYLISVAVAEYIDYTIYANPIGSTQPIPIQNFIYNNPNTLTNFQNQINETVAFMNLFSTQFGLYPFADEKYGHCMAPLSGGMEHQTMTTQGFFEKSLTAHELAHQWFGNQVTCASWTDIWVNEGFASYAEYLMLENLYPSQKAQDMLDRHNNIMSAAGGSVWVLDSLSDASIFNGRLVYDKGAAIVHTMRFMLNDDIAFFQALKNFQVNYADSFAMAGDVKMELENVSTVDFNPVFEQWYYGEGYPTYSAKFNTIGNDLLLEISHTASKPGSTPTFTNDLEIKLQRGAIGDTVIRVAINSNQSQFYIPNTKTVNFLVIDPNNWIINKIGSIIKDANFTAQNEELQPVNTIEVYPNPSSDGLFHLRTHEDSEYEYVLYNNKGQVMAEEKSILGDFNLQVPEQGMYILEIRNVNQGEAIRKLIIRN